MTTIAVPKQAEYEEAGKDFDEMAKGLLTAADLTRNLHVQPGTFAEAEGLQQAVEQFCQERQDVLEIYSEACTYVGEIVRLCGETYTGSEKERVEKGSTLEGRLGAAVQGLERLHRRLDDVRQGGQQKPQPPGYHLQDLAKQAPHRGVGFTPGTPFGPGPEVSRAGTPPPPSTTTRTVLRPYITPSTAPPTTTRLTTGTPALPSRSATVNAPSTTPPANATPPVMSTTPVKATPPVMSTTPVKATPPVEATTSTGGSKDA